MTVTNALTETVRQVLSRYGAQGKRVCVGYSGGLDSAVLIHALTLLRKSQDLQLTAVHVHHGLSVNADKWALFCERACLSAGIPLFVARVKVDVASGGGLEALAREARYGVFDKLDVDFIALAQHADDQAETVLHQLLRGTGLKGLAGMGEVRTLQGGVKLIRPVLSATRADILTFAEENQLSWVEDESNDNVVYTRNFIRHELVPRLLDRFPQYRDSLARVGRHAAEADQMLSELAAIDLKWDGNNAYADSLDRLSLERQVNALYHWLQWLQRPDGRQVALPTHAQLTEWAVQLFRPKPNDKPHQAAGHYFAIRREKNLLLLERK